jgi:hypothetical protein
VGGETVRRSLSSTREKIMSRMKTAYKVIPVYSGITTSFWKQVNSLNEHLADGWEIERVDTSNDALLYLVKKKEVQQ